MEDLKKKKLILKNPSLIDQKRAREFSGPRSSLHYTFRFTYYLPSTLFVITSWVSFLIPPEVVPGRMALLVTLFLVLINIFNNVTSITPNTEGMTALSSWMLG